MPGSNGAKTVTARPDSLDVVLCWPMLEGGPHDAARQQTEGWLLNGAAQSCESPSSGSKLERLQQAGLSVLQTQDMLYDSAASWRYYHVKVFHLQAISVSRLAETQSWSKAQPAGALPRGGHSSQRDWNESDPLYRRVVRTAIRALYALGMDFGEVEIGLHGAGRTAVRAVKLPALSAVAEADSAADAGWLRAARQFAAELAAHAAAAPQLRIGADPEFVLLRQDGRIVPAARFLAPRGEIGCDAVPVGRRLQYPVAELRPAPESGPAALAASLQRLLRRAAGQIGEPGLRWLAGAMPVPGLALGGHIHLSGVPLSGRLLRWLDSCVAMPLALAEDPAGQARRPRYGWLGDFRRQPHGGFEYRAPPSWLVSPALARAAFALALLAAREHAAPAGLGAGELPAERAPLVRAYYTGDRAQLAAGLMPFLQQLRGLPSYALYAPFIAPLLTAIERGAVWDEQRDIRGKWRIPIA